jgi:hypothetical protein
MLILLSTQESTGIICQTIDFEIAHALKCLLAASCFSGSVLLAEEEEHFFFIEP